MTEENKDLEKELEETEKTEETAVVDENKENAIETEDKIEIEDKVEEVSAESETIESTETTEAKKENSIFTDNLKNVGIMLSISLAAYLILDMVILRILGYKFAKAYIGTGILFIYLLVTIVYPVFKKDKKH